MGDHSARAFLACLVVAAGLLAAAPAAHGSCGHYTHTNPSPQQQAGEEPTQVPLRLPCRGPTCQQQPEQAPLAPPVVPASRAAEKALAGSHDLLDLAGAFVPANRRRHVRAIHRCFPPERPPRV